MNRIHRLSAIALVVVIAAAGCGSTSTYVAGNAPSIESVPVTEPNDLSLDIFPSVLTVTPTAIDIGGSITVTTNCEATPSGFEVEVEVRTLDGQFVAGEIFYDGSSGTLGPFQAGTFVVRSTCFILECSVPGIPPRFGCTDVPPPVWPQFTVGAPTPTTTSPSMGSDVIPPTR